MSSGALATLSGAKTGRTPKDKRVVREPGSEADIWWAGKGGEGSPNFEMDHHSFLLNRERAVDYLNMLDRLYVFDGYAGWDPVVSPTPCQEISISAGCMVHAILIDGGNWDWIPYC